MAGQEPVHPKSRTFQAATDDCPRKRLHHRRRGPDRSELKRTSWVERCSIVRFGEFGFDGAAIEPRDDFAWSDVEVRFSNGVLSAKNRKKLGDSYCNGSVLGKAVCDGGLAWTVWPYSRFDPEAGAAETGTNSSARRRAPASPGSTCRETRALG